MTHVIFYQIKTKQAMLDTNIVLKLACNRSINIYRKKKSIYLACNDKKEANQISNFLWTNEINSFIPNLIINQSQDILSNLNLIYIGYLKHIINENVSICVNMRDSISNDYINFSYIFDFIPLDENKKELARKRYRNYQKLNMNIQIKDYYI